MVGCGMHVFYLCLIALVLAGCAAPQSQGDAAPPARSRETKARPLILDVRSVGEFSSGHIDGAVNLPVGEVEAGIGALVPDKARAIVVHCASGKRSAAAAAKLGALGYTNVRDLGSMQNARLALGVQEK